MSALPLSPAPSSPVSSTSLLFAHILPQDNETDLTSVVASSPGDGACALRGLSKSKTFAVSLAEINDVQSSLSHAFPSQPPLNPSYVKSVMSQANSSNVSERRTVAYSLLKLRDYLTWRAEFGVPGLLAPGADACKADPKIFKHMQEASVYWYGVDKFGRPILWERFDQFDWGGLDAQSKIQYYVVLFESCFGAMPMASAAEFDASCSNSSIPAQTKFSVVAETGGINYFQAFRRPTFFLQVAQLFIKGFPDRLGYFVSKSTSGMKMALKLMSPILPTSVNDKIELLVNDEFTKRLTEDVLLNGVDDLPNFFGGKKVHEREIICDFGRMMEQIKSDMEAFARTKGK